VRWTETTEKAATTPEQEAVLAGGKVATIKGELVEVSRYLELGSEERPTGLAAPTASSMGNPLASWTTQASSLLFVEQHDPRRYGEIDVRDQLASLVA
jgi:hypothetical protein